MAWPWSSFALQWTMEYGMGVVMGGAEQAGKLTVAPNPFLPSQQRISIQLYTTKAIYSTLQQHYIISTLCGEALGILLR